MDESLELPSFARQLRVLGFAGEVDVFSGASVQTLVCWLDERFLGCGDERLRSANTPQEWEKAFSALLDKLGSPFSFDSPFSDLQRATVLEWLLNMAVSYLYEQQSLASEDAEDPLTDALAEVCLKTMAQTALLPEAQMLARELQLPAPANEAEARSLILACARQALRVGKRNEQQQQLEEGQQQQQHRPQAEVEYLPVSGTATDLLRVLHCENAAEQEKAANNLLVRLQNLTAKPVVDASLGKGGR